MKSFTLAILAVFAALCQADSFAVPDPWEIRKFRVWEPTHDESGIGGLWTFDIVDTAPDGPSSKGFNTTCSYNFRYPKPVEHPWDRENVFGCDDTSVHWQMGFLGGDCYAIAVAHEYHCHPQVIEPCEDSGTFQFCVADTLQETDQFFTAIPHKGMIQIRPLFTWPSRDRRNRASTTEVTI